MLKVFHNLYQVSAISCPRYVNWARLAVLGVLPLSLLTFLNYNIYMAVRSAMLAMDVNLAKDVLGSGEPKMSGQQVSQSVLAIS